MAVSDKTNISIKAYYWTGPDHPVSEDNFHPEYLLEYWSRSGSGEKVDEPCCNCGGNGGGRSIKGVFFQEGREVPNKRPTVIIPVLRACKIVFIVIGGLLKRGKVLIVREIFVFKGRKCRRRSYFAIILFCSLKRCGHEEK